jgi:hypothetical protein
MIKSMCTLVLAAAFGMSAFAADTPKLKDGKLTIEAETGKISGQTKVVEDKVASGGKAVVSVKGGTIVYEFIVDEAGDYVIWGKIIGPDGNKDSFFVVVNGGEKLIWDMGAKKYTWKAMKGRKKPSRHKLKKGKNTLKLSYREPQAKIDQIHIAKPGQKPPKK